MWPLVIVVTVAAASQDWEYVVNDLFDDSLDQMEASLREQIGGYVDLAPVTIGGYSLEGVTIGDLTTLRRHGNVTMSSKGNVVKVNGYLELPNMMVRGGNITSLEANMQNPVITFNGFEGFFFDFWSDLQDKKCKNGYHVERKYWTRGTVHLTSDTKQYENIDITKFIQLHEDDLSEPLEIALRHTFGSYFGFCNTIRKLQVR